MLTDLEIVIKTADYRSEYMQCVTVKITLNYYLNISVQAANLSDYRIESNRNFFSPNWNALVQTEPVA